VKKKRGRFGVDARAALQGVQHVVPPKVGMFQQVYNRQHFVAKGSRFRQLKPLPQYIYRGLCFVHIMPFPRHH